MKSITKCRICKNQELVSIIDLGIQSLTGVFPQSIDTKVTSGPLNLVKCVKNETSCGLVQLKHSYNVHEMFGKDYGYKSSLNISMVNHLSNKVKKILSTYPLDIDDLIIDIGSNDGTTLNQFPRTFKNLVGIDPTGKNFKDNYNSNVKLIPDFFSSKLIKKEYQNKKAKLVTAFSMFYDLEDPLTFMEEIYDILDYDGIWIFEQSYMPSMIKMNSFDTICHEHIEYYSLSQIKWMTDKIGFQIIDVEFNDINGGSFSVSVKKNKNKDISYNSNIANILKIEKKENFDTLTPYIKFKENVINLKKSILKLLTSLKETNKKISIIGASTKGNVILQYCGIDGQYIDFVGEVNKHKFNCFTPGTNLKIISEEEVLNLSPDYLLILPWHFKKFFIENKKFKKFNLIFPLPSLTIEKKD